MAPKAKAAGKRKRDEEAAQEDAAADGAHEERAAKRSASARRGRAAAAGGGSSAAAAAAAAPKRKRALGALPAAVLKALPREAVECRLAFAGFAVFQCPLKPQSEPALRALRDRSEERRVGKECIAVCRSRWSPYH